MELLPTNIPEVLVIKPKVFQDERGYFLESFNKQVLDELGFRKDFVQDNESCSKKGVLRGLHYQVPPYQQGKLVRVIKGSVLDVAVDIRKGSSTYGIHVAKVLDDKSKEMLWIPPGFAHGFVSLEDGTIFSYKCTGFYNKESEGCIIWNDPQLDINWGINNPEVSEKDNKGLRFNTLDSPF